MAVAVKTKVRAVLATSIGLALGASGLGAVSGAAPAASASGVPDTLALAGDLADQKVAWESCTLSSSLPPEVADVLLATPGFECATVVVPQDWHNPTNGKTFRLRISRVTNLSPTNPDYQGTLLVNPGGPGGEALHWAANIFRRGPELKQHFNSIGIDPRGVGQSEAPECGIDGEVAATPGPERAKAVGAACSAVEAVTKITTEQTAYDFDFVRGLLDVPQITYIGYSYGTWLGTWYGTLFGPHIKRMILDSAIDGTDSTLEKTWDSQPVARDRQFVDAMLPYTLRSIARDVATSEGEQQEALKRLPTDTATAQQWYWNQHHKLAAQDPSLPSFLWMLTGGLSAFPDPTNYPLAAGTIRLFLEAEAQDRANAATGTAAASSAPSDFGTVPAQVAAATTIQQKTDILLAAVNARLTPEQRASLAPQVAQVRRTVTAAVEQVTAEESQDLVNVYDPFDAIRCGDGQWTQGAAHWDAWTENLAKNTPLTNMFADQLYPACGFWPTTNPTKPAANKKTFPQTLVIQAEEDSQTAYEGGYASGTGLPNTSVVLVDNATKHGYFPYRTSCVDDPAFSFLLSGAQTKKATICQGKPLPEDTATYEMWSPINVNGKHVPGKGTIPSRVQDPETGVVDLGSVSSQIAQAESTELITDLVRQHLAG